MLFYFVCCQSLLAAIRTFALAFVVCVGAPILLKELLFFYTEYHEFEADQILPGNVIMMVGGEEAEAAGDHFRPEELEDDHTHSSDSNWSEDSTSTESENEDNNYSNDHDMINEVE